MRSTILAALIFVPLALDWTSGPSSDMECARATIAACEWIGEPEACQFGELPDRAIRAACNEQPGALACATWRDQ